MDMFLIKVSSQYSWHFVDFSWHNMSSSPCASCKTHTDDDDDDEEEEEEEEEDG